MPFSWGTTSLISIVPIKVFTHSNKAVSAYQNKMSFVLLILSMIICIIWDLKVVLTFFLMTGSFSWWLRILILPLSVSLEFVYNCISALSTYCLVLLSTYNGVIFCVVTTFLGSSYSIDINFLSYANC